MRKQLSMFGGECGVVSAVRGIGGPGGGKRDCGLQATPRFHVAVQGHLRPMRALARLARVVGTVGVSARVGRAQRDFLDGPRIVHVMGCVMVIIGVVLGSRLFVVSAVLRFKYGRCGGERRESKQGKEGQRNRSS